MNINLSYLDISKQMEKSWFCSKYMCCSVKMMRNSNKSVKLSSILFVYIATKLSAKCHLQTIVPSGAKKCHHILRL